MVTLSSLPVHISEWDHAMAAMATMSKHGCDDEIESKVTCHSVIEFLMTLVSIVIVTLSFWGTISASQSPMIR